MKKLSLITVLFYTLTAYSQDVVLNDDRLMLRSSSNNNHTLQWVNTLSGNSLNGPFLKGLNGGALGTSSGGTKAALTWKSNGNVGIGVTNPASKLDLNGKMNIRTGGLYLNSGLNNHFRIGGNLNTNGYINIHQPNTVNNTYLDYTENFYIRRIADNPNGPETNLGAIMGFQYDGTVTIGIWEKYTHALAPNPDNSRLQVNGGITCERLKVIADVPNSDHVFEKNYELKSLEEVEKFIKKNKHLPEIPSAKAFQENGYYVGEMDDLLLRKVEELTLYVIELQNKITKLEQKK